MKIFISWSGEKSKALATKLHDWLPFVLHYVEPWVSASDIDAGKRWSTEVAKHLDESLFGILCLTLENVNSPWVLFEAGALAKSMTTGAVVPYLIDLDFGDLIGPLTQFQGKKAEKAPTFEMLTAINKISTKGIPGYRLQELFDLLWPKLAEAVSSSAGTKTPELTPRRPPEELLDELISLVRSMDQRLASVQPVSKTGSRLPKCPFGKQICGHVSQTFGNNPEAYVHQNFVGRTEPVSRF